ncbi:MAG: 23S rRNA (guanosine(2251)-2'-O)-methyltransferase RlmB [Ignavibacteria bacterium]|nr:23S rRNA (guanosine(2251)-2'-O)-methyltransferase RlmB [Ignavibacteria bacterium]
MLVIGKNPVLETLNHSPQTINKIILLKGLTENKINEITRLAKPKNIIIEILEKSLFEKLLDKKDKSEGISQGIAAVVNDFEYSKTTEILKSINSKTSSTLIILDEIQDPHNFGAIVRTAVSAGTNGIIISEKNSVKVNHTVIKTSSGATNYIKISKEPNIYKTIDILKENGFKIIGTALNASENLYEYTFPEKCAVIFGSEGEGLRKNIRNLCNNLIKIPMSGKMNSLNVSVSAGVILYEIFRQRNSG